MNRIGYSLLKEMARKEQYLDDIFFKPYITRMENELQNAPNRAKEGMNNCLIYVGKRNEVLKKLVLKARKKIGKVKIDHGGTRCKTPNIKESLQRKRIYKRKKKN
ncbi:hypothetical protein ES705_27407 [subsurface metagenome]